MRAELISNIKHMALPSVLFEESNMMQFITDVVNSKKWATTFGVDSTNVDYRIGLQLSLLVKDYKDCMSKEKAKEVQKKAAAQKAKILIGSSLKDSRLTLLGDKPPEEFKNPVTAANSVGRMTYFADERRRLLSIVAMDYPYRFLQEQLVAPRTPLLLQGFTASSLVVVAHHHQSSSSIANVSAPLFWRNCQISS